MIFVACAFSSRVYAQLEVQTSGDVKISKRAAINGAGVRDSIALHVKTPEFSSGHSAYGVYATVKQEHPLFITTGRGLGVFGRTLQYGTGGSLQRPSSYAFYAGVVGMSASFGVGVYGTSSASLPTVWMEGNYAGYFNGDVKITGTLTLPTIATYGDSNHMENVTRLGSRNYTDLLSQLNPISYTLQDGTIQDFKGAPMIHYGLIAQELREIAPELVLEDGGGNLSISYMELIPILIKSIQELSAKVEELEKQIK